MYNVKLLKAKGVVPELDAVLRAVFMKDPSLRYLTVKTDRDDLAYALSIYLGVDLIGSIEYGPWKQGRGEPKVQYQITSPYIKKERYPTDTVLTKNANTAIKTLLNKELFKPKAVDKRIQEEQELAERRIGRFVSYANYDINRPSTSDNYALTKILMQIHDGETPDLSGIYNMNKLMDDKNREAVANYEIAKQVEDTVKAKQISIVKHEIDESITMTSMRDGTVVYQGKSTYELPEWAQSKLAMLKAIKDDQVIRNVGFKIAEKDDDVGTSTYYVLVDGEIPDMIE